MNETLSEIQFIDEVDQLKSIIRQSSLYDGSRRENSAEHSWHLALAVMTFQDLADFPFDVSRAIQMALIHDVVEIDAGDTFIYDTAALEQKFTKEEKAAERIFGLLPGQKDKLVELWSAYEKQACPESLFVGALDRFLPIYSMCKNQGGAWKRHGITKDRVLLRNQVIESGSRRLWEVTQKMIEECFTKHF